MMFVVPRVLENSIVYPTSTNGFTLGHMYQVDRNEGFGVIVRNDNGHQRFVSLDEGPSPHLIYRFVDKFTGRPGQKCVGYFEVLDRGAAS